MNKDRPPKPTLRTVAAAAGVSQMTASRALRGGGDVSDATRARVHAAAGQLGYVPNRIAGALASRHVNLVGVVFPSLSSTVFPEVLAGITETLGKTPLQPVVGVSGYDLEREETVIRDMLSWRPAGLIVAGLEHSDASRRMLANANIPVVEVMDVDGTPVDRCVGISHDLAGRMMATEILSRGYRNIGFIGTKMPQDFRARKRCQGFEAVLAEAGLALVDRQQYTGGSTLAKGRELTGALLARSPEIDCIYYSSDTMCAGGLMHCLSAGLSVPQDLALAGFNNLDLLAGLPLRLATTDSHRFAIGQKAAAMIRDGAVHGTGDKAPKVIALTPTVSAGESL